MKRILVACAIAWAPLGALADGGQLSDNEFCNNVGTEAGQAYETGRDIEKQKRLIQGFIRNMRDGKEPNKVGALAVIGFAKGYCMGWLEGARVGIQKGAEEAQKKNTF